MSKKSFLTIFDVGVNKNLTAETNAEIRLSNKIIVMLLFVAFFYALFFTAIMQVLLALVAYVVSGLLIVSYFLNSKHYFRLSKSLLLSLPVGAAFFYNSVLSSDTGIYLFNMAVVPTTFIVLSDKDIFLRRLFIALAIVNFLFLGLGYGSFMISIELGAAVNQLFFVTISLMTFLVVYYTVAFYKEKSQKMLYQLYSEKEDKQRYINELKTLNKTIEMQKQQTDDELSMAKQMQLELLPTKGPTLTGYQLSHFYQAARVVSGDFLDYIEISDSKCGVIIADIVGKGIPASLMAHAVKTVLHTAFKHPADILSPAAVMMQLDKLLSEYPTIHRHVPMVFGILDSKANTFTYTNAGHEPGVILKQNGVVKELTISGPPLGMHVDGENMKRDQYTEDKITLHPGDKMVLFTDGFTDIKSDTDERFDNEQFNQVLYDNKALTGQAYVERVVEVCNAFQNVANQADDMTLIVLERAVD